MGDTTSAHAGRCLLVWAAGTAAAGAVLRLLGGGLLAPAPGDFDEWLVRGCLVALAGCTAWAWLALTRSVLDAARAVPRPSSPGVPRVLRRAVHAACGVALVGGLAAPAATAASTVGGSGPEPTEGSPAALLGGMPLPERAVDGPLRSGVVVAAGDCLWDLARADLPPGASDQDIANRVRRLHRLNRDVIGPDPDLILPGQHLRLPAR